MARSVGSLFLLFFTITLAQSQELKVINAFDPLIDHVWVIEGEWGTGLKFKQEISFKKEASGTIITANTNGYLNEEQSKWGPRNYGIRQIDAKTGKMMFYEYDAFGGMTKGEVLTIGKDFYYIYEYEGLTLADKWEFVDNSNYTYIIGTYSEGQIGDIYLKGTISRK